MSNYNLKRGEELYYKELKDLCKRYPEITAEIMVLGSCFSNKAGVMQEGIVNDVIFKNDDTMEFDLNGVPSYKKLSLSVITSLTKYNTDSFKEQITNVIKSYNNGDYKKYELKTDNINSNQNSDYLENINLLEENLRQSHNLQSQELQEIDQKGNISSRSIDVDEINLLDDFDVDDMTLEGLRSSGLIDTDYDSTSDVNLNFKEIKNKIEYGKLELDDNGNISIYCPYTNSTNVYQIDSTTYASFETDKPFKVNFNLADFKPDQS